MPKINLGYLSERLVLLSDWRSWQTGIESILEDLRSGKLKPEDLNSDLLSNTVAQLKGGFKKGFGVDIDSVDFSTPDYNFIQEIRSNLYYFSAAKTYQQLKDFNNMLVDSSGKVVDYNTFNRNIREYLLQARTTDFKYNRQHLKVEYNSTIAQGQSATRWKKFEENADIFPNLEYRTAGDSHVRKEHARLDGIIKPINDPFWNHYNPPNDYGCRCRLRPTNAKPTDTIPDVPLKKQFQNNVAKTGVVFPDSHPYFAQNEIDKAAIKAKANDYWLQELSERNLVVYQKYATDPGYVAYDFNRKTGGGIVIEDGAKYSNTELEAAKLLQTLSHMVVIKKRTDALYTKTADFYVDGLKTELKTPDSINARRIEERLRDGFKQANAVILNVTKDSTRAEIENGIRKAAKADEPKSVVVLYKGKKAVITPRDMKMKDYRALNELFKS